MSIHVNSIIAYWDNIFKFSKRECEILGYLFQNPAPATDRKIKDALRYADMNAVRPRITELVSKGCLDECGSVRCDVTGKQVRLVKIRERNLDKQMRMAI